MESDQENLRGKLAGLAGVMLSDADLAELIGEIISGGGGVHIEIDDQTRYRLVRREGRFVLSRDPMRAKPSSVPPRR